MFGILSVILFTVAVCTAYSFNSYLESKAGYSVEFVRLLDTPDSVKFDDLAKLEDYIGEEDVSGYKETITGVSNKYGLYTNGVKLVQINENYSCFYRNKMIEGSFPDEQAINRGDYLAVISNVLAVRLYKSTNAIGNEIDIQGERFTVSGVYKGRDSILASICGDGFDRVFVPYKCVFNEGRDIISILTLAKDTGITVAGFEEDLKAKLDVDLSAYDAVDIPTLLIVLSQYNRLFVFISGILVAIYILVFMIKHVKKVARRLKIGMDADYSIGILKAEKKHLIADLSVFFICGLVIFIIIYFIRFRLYISNDYIPDDNIFDIKFYFERLMNGIRTDNSFPDRSYSLIENAYRNLLYLNLSCLSAASILLIVTFSFFNLLKKSKKILWSRQK